MNKNEVKEKKKGFGGYFLKCLGVMFLIAFLAFLIPSFIRMFWVFFTKDAEKSSSLLHNIQIFVPMITIYSVVPVSLIYAAIKTNNNK